MKYELFFKPYDANASIKDKIKTIKENNDNSKALANEISALSKRCDVITHADEVHSFNEPVSTGQLDEEDKELEDIYNRISIINTADKEDEIVLDLFSRIIKTDNLRFKYLIDKLKIKLYSEISFYTSILAENLTKETYEEVRETILEIKNKIDLLDELDKEEEIIKTTSSSNNLVFLLSETGNMAVYDTLKKEIPREYYPAFKELLEGIKTGNMKNLKYLSKQKYYEVKDFKIRITFDRLTSDTYIILDAFMKKEDTSRYYRSRLSNKAKLYERDAFLSKISSPSFIEEGNDNYNAIISLLSNGPEVIKCLTK